MDLNLAALSPEEKDQLLTQLIAAHEGGAGSGSGGDTPAPDATSDTPDAPQGGIEGAVEALLKVVEVLINVVDEQSQRLDMLQKTLMDDLIGGIETLYKGNQRASAIDGLRGKYGSLFDPHLGALKEIAPDDDVFDKLYDLIEGAKGGEGWDDSKESDMASQLAGAIGDKIAKIKGPAADAGKSDAPAATVEVTKVSGDPEGADPALMDRIRKMKDFNKARGK